ncbi:hypothetical protein ACFL1B_05875 [Nanoarchaeota archaeon]
MAFYKSIDEIYGKDPEKSYLGGFHRRTKLLIHDLNLDEGRAGALLDVQNAFAHLPDFHLTMMDSINAVALLVFAYRCHKLGATHSELGSARIVDFNEQFPSLITASRDIEMLVKEESYELNGKGIAHSTYSFDLGKGSHVGQIRLTEKV